MTTYRGSPGEDSMECVTVGGRPLALYLKEVSHSPTGFAWGYGGSGPAQLAYAILRHHMKDRAKAQSIYQEFKFAVIAKLPRDEPWELTSEQVEDFLKEHLIREVMDA